jgi:hypothetical protein
MSNCTQGANENGALRDTRAYEDEISEALVRDAEIDADSGLAISLDELDERIRDRES